MFLSIWMSILMLGSLAPASSFPQWGSLKPGPYQVGFRLINTLDHSRTYWPRTDFDGRPTRTPTSRPVQIWIWYPARAASNREYMRYRDYIYLAAGAMDKQKEEAQKKFMAAPIAAGADRSRIDALMRTRTAALAGARPAAGTFPLVVLGQGIGFESPTSHTIICEYLASHGYIVATCPLLGFSSLPAGNDLASLETEVRDMEYVIGYMQSVGGVDKQRLAIAGFDLGGMAALLLQMRNTNVGALCTYASGIDAQHNTAVLKQSAFFDPSRLTVPLLHMTIPKSKFEGFGVHMDNALFEMTSHPDMYRLEFSSLDHSYFTSLGMISTKDVPNLIAEGGVIATSAERRLGYESACRYMLNFFDAYIKGVQKALGYLRAEPSSNGVPKEQLTVEAKPAAHQRPTEQQFVRLILDDGIRKGVEAYRRLKQTDPTYIPFKESTLYNLAYRMRLDGNLEDLIETLRLNVEAYPTSSKGYEVLGRAYMLHGDKELAIRSYRRAVDIDPNNTNAVRMLQRLTGK